MAVARRTEISHVVLVRPGVAENGGPNLKTVVVEERLGGFPVYVVNHSPLQREARHQEILAKEIGHEHVVFA